MHIFFACHIRLERYVERGLLLFMNDKSISVLEQYGLEAGRFRRGRGGIIVSTSQGLKLLYECNRNDSFYERENRVTRQLEAGGFQYLDTYCANLEGGLFATDTQGRKYILKNWMEARECDLGNLKDITEAVQTLARLHQALLTSGIQDDENIHYHNTTDLRMQFDKHTKEIKLVRNYFRNKKNRNEFELLARKVIQNFYEEAERAEEMLEEISYGERLETARARTELCHGSYNYHNILFCDRGSAVTNFDRCRVDCQINDLYQFMRKILEKNNWEMELAYKMLEEYDKITPIAEIDMEILAVSFAYPEKFWKIINFYYGSNKSWIPRKSIEKLELVIAQNPARQNFVETLHS